MRWLFPIALASLIACEGTGGEVIDGDVQDAGTTDAGMDAIEDASRDGGSPEDAEADGGELSFFCQVPTSFPADGIIVTSPADVESIRDRTELSALLVCEVAELRSIDLPNLIRVTSWIDIRRCPDLEEVTMPALQSAALLRFSELPNLTRIEFGSLEELTAVGLASSLSIGQTPRLSTIRFPRLERSASGVDFFQADANVVEFPALQEARGFSVASSGTSFLELPVLTGTSGLSLASCPQLVRAALPQVRVLRFLEVFGSANLETVDLSGVERILGNEFSGGLTIRDEESYTEFDLSSLERIDGRLLLTTLTRPDLSWLSSLQQVGREVDLSLGYSTDLTGLDALTDVSGDFLIQVGFATRVDLPALRRIGGAFSARAITTDLISLPSLESAGAISIADTVIGTSTVGFGSLREVDGNLSFTSIEGLGALRLPQLETIGANLLVSDNAFLATVEAPVLVSVAGDFTIANNPLLPTCEAQEIVDRLGAGIGGSVDTSGNDDVATCP